MPRTKRINIHLAVSAREGGTVKMKMFPNRLQTLFVGAMKFTVALLLVLTPGYALAQSEIEALRTQLEEQRALIREQQKLLQTQQQKIDQQARELDKLGVRLDQMEQAAGKAVQTSVAQPQVPTPESSKVAERTVETVERDSVGDLNAGAVQAGKFPGSFRIPGTRDISLAIGGFVKAVAIYDTKAEAMGADFLPATLGTRRADKDGGFSIDATITRLFLDARAPTPFGQLRGYVEGDLNNSNDGSLGLKLRHAYGSWKTDYGTLTAGHTWSTLMDLKILPEGLTEPTVSGAIFMRQPQIRWSQPLGSQFTLHAAVEDPSSSDVFSDQPTLGKTKYPDGVLGLEYDHNGIWHLRVNSILRNIEVDLPSGSDDSELGWGVTLTGHLNLFDRDRLRFGGAYGKGLGRYLLGIRSIDGSAVDPATDRLRLRNNWGALVSYEHRWTDKFRSTAMFGYARSNPLTWQPAGTFMSSTYAAANLMWQVLPYLTLGFEYGYGRRENKDNSDLDNHRFMFGFQFY